MEGNAVEFCWKFESRIWDSKPAGMEQTKVLKSFIIFNGIGWMDFQRTTSHLRPTKQLNVKRTFFERPQKQKTIAAQTSQVLAIYVVPYYFTTKTKNSVCHHIFVKSLGRASDRRTRGA